jgi:DNA-directed RNA polymerase specialized sigma24 family protein
VELAAEAEARAREQKARARSAAIAAGMAAVREQGVHVGRPAGAEDRETFLARPTSQRVLAALRDDPGLSIRKAAAVAGVSINTVRKVAAVVGYVFQ